MDGILHQLSVRLSQLIFLAKKWPILSWKWRFFGDFWMIEGIYLLFLYPKWMKIRSIIRVNEDKKKFQTPPTHFLAENCFFLPQKACYFFLWQLRAVREDLPREENWWSWISHESGFWVMATSSIWNTYWCSTSWEYIYVIMDYKLIAWRWGEGVMSSKRLHLNYRLQGKKEMV